MTKTSTLSSGIVNRGTRDSKSGLFHHLSLFLVWLGCRSLHFLEAVCILKGKEYVTVNGSPSIPGCWTPYTNSTVHIDLLTALPIDMFVSRPRGAVLNHFVMSEVPFAFCLATLGPLKQPTFFDHCQLQQKRWPSHWEAAPSVFWPSTTDLLID